MRDKFLADMNAAPTKPEAAVLAREPAKAPEPGDILFGPLAELWKTRLRREDRGGQAAHRARRRKVKYDVVPRATSCPGGRTRASRTSRPRRSWTGSRRSARPGTRCAPSATP